MTQFSIQPSPLDQGEASLLTHTFHYLSGDFQEMENQTITSLAKKIVFNMPVQNIVIRIIKLFLQQKSTSLMHDFQQRSLDLVASLFETCEITTVLMLEVYVVPLLTKAACQIAQNEEKKPFKKGKKQKMNKKIDQLISLRSIQLLLIWSYVKPKKIHDCQQIGISSLCFDGLLKFMEMIPNNEEFLVSTKSEQQICMRYGLNYKDIDRKAKLLRKKYLAKLFILSEEDNSVVKSFSEFYMNKLFTKIQTKGYEPSPALLLQNSRESAIQEIIQSLAEEFSESCLDDIPELDYKLLYKTLDNYLTSPLVKFIFEILGNSNNFYEKKLCLNVLSDLVRWGDIEAYLIIIYSDVIENIVYRVSEIRGDKSFEEGRKIYPQITSKDEEKKQFYMQFLRFLQILEVCLEEDLVGESEIPKIKTLITILKNEKKFKFPENLMIKRIQNEFFQAIKENIQRNTLILNMIKQNPSSLMNYQASSFSSSRVQTRTRIQFMKKVETIEDELQNLVYAQQWDKIRSSIIQLKKFQKDYENQLLDIEDFEQLNNKQFYEFLIRGQRVLHIYNSIRNQCDKVLSYSITFQRFKIQTKEVIENIKFQSFYGSTSGYNLDRSSISSQVQQNHSFGTINDLFGLSQKKASSSSRSVQLIDNYLISPTDKSQVSDPSQSSQFTMKEIDFNEVKIQKPKFKLLDHSASYSSLYTKHNLSLGLKVKRSVSDRIQTILNNMRKICTSKNEYFSVVKSTNGKVNDVINNDELMQPSGEPGLNSVLEEKGEKFMTFRECLNLEKQTIKESIFAKTYLKKDKDLRDSLSEENLKEKDEASVTKESQSCESDSTILMIKNNAYKDLVLKNDLGRLINANAYENLFKKLPKNFEKVSLLKQKMKIYKDKLVQVRIIINSIENEVNFDIHIIPNCEIKNIKLTQISSSLSNIKLKFNNQQYEKFCAGSQYLLKGIASLSSLDQIAFPKLQLLFSYMGSQKKVNFEVPLNIHHFTKYFPLGQSGEGKIDSKCNILRTDKFLVSKEMGKICQLQKIIENLRLLRQKNSEKLLGVQGFFPFSKVSFKIYMKVHEGEVQIFSLSQHKKTQPIESLISTMRFALEHQN